MTIRLASGKKWIEYGKGRRTARRHFTADSRKLVRVNAYSLQMVFNLGRKLDAKRRIALVIPRYGVIKFSLGNAPKNQRKRVNACGTWSRVHS